MKSMKKTIAAAVAIAMIFGCVIGGTVAWLYAESKTVVNTFTVGNIFIDLTENTEEYKMIPGNDIAKDPTVTVDADSEACWLFVKVEKSANYDNYMNGYKIADGWSPLSNYPGVYYRSVNDTNADQPFSVLKDNKVTVLDTVKKPAMDEIDGLDANGEPLTGDALKAETTKRPTLTFTAYAVQKDNVASAADAWAIALNGGNPVTASGETV